jgi:hypothetical protein
VVFIYAGLFFSSFLTPVFSEFARRAFGQKWSLGAFVLLVLHFCVFFFFFFFLGYT